MIEFRIDKETPEYLTLTRDTFLDLYEKEDHGRNFSEIIHREMAVMMIKMFDYEKYAREQNITTFKIKKDSLFGRCLVENNGTKGIVDYTNYISYENIRNAMEIAIFNDDAKMSSKIIPLFQKQRLGTKEDLLKEFPRDEEVVDYILENNDFEKYLAQINHEEELIEDKSFVVYEDGEWSIKNLEEEYVRVPKKS